MLPQGVERLGEKERKVDASARNKIKARESRER